MRYMVYVFSLLTLCCLSTAYGKASVSTEHRSGEKSLFLLVQTVDQILEKRRQELNLPQVPAAEDHVFFRRAWINGAGYLPSERQVRAFLRSKDPQKRAKLIESVLASDAHADLIAMRFADMLRVKSEFPINLWPNAVQAFHYKLRNDIFNNRSYGDMVKEMLTSSGSNFRQVYANFFRTTGDRTPEGLAKITALTFMGLRVERLPEKERKDFSNFFSRIRYKSTYEWKEEIVYTDPAEKLVRACLPGSGYFSMRSPGVEPRKVLAEALVDGRNPYFARAFVNRAWSWFFGKGLIDPADDIVPETRGLDRFWKNLGLKKSDPRLVHEKLLDFLAEEFCASNYDMRHLFRIIMNSSAYQAASRTEKKYQLQTEKYFFSYPIRRMEAEVISDCLSMLTGSYGRYMSVIPEPFTYLPYGTKAVQVADGSISSALLDQFGRPSRDTGLISDRRNFITASQRLYLLNSGTLYGQLTRRGYQIARECRWNLTKGMERMYLMALGRYPTAQERKTIQAYYNKLARKKRGRIWPDLIWVLANSKEFLYYH